MPLNDEVRNRLLNWKFDQALTALTRQTDDGDIVPSEEEYETIRALALTFGDIGWFDGSLADVVRAAVWFLGVVDD